MKLITSRVFPLELARPDFPRSYGFGVREASAAPCSSPCLLKLFSVPPERGPRALSPRRCFDRLGGLGWQQYRYDATNISFMSRAKRIAGAVDQDELALAAVDRTEPTPLHEQVAAEIRRAIADGEAGPGERIPQAKDLAAVLGVNTNTVLRALRLLRDEGLLEMGRGRAITIVGTPERTAVVDKARELLAFARSRGFKRDEVMALIDGLR